MLTRQALLNPHATPLAAAARPLRSRLGALGAALALRLAASALLRADKADSISSSMALILVSATA